MNEVETLGRVVGQNVRKLREEQDATMEDLVATARSHGITWGVPRVQALQRGNSNPKLGTLLVLSWVLNCEMADLLATDAHWVDIGDGIVVYGRELPTLIRKLDFHRELDDVSDDEWARLDGGWESADDLMRHVRSVIPDDKPVPTIEAMREMDRRTMLLDVRTAQLWDIHIDLLNAISFAFYQRSLSEERDAESSPNVVARGNRTVDLRRPLWEVVDKLTAEQRQPNGKALQSKKTRAGGLRIADSRIKD